jgi:HEAT repeat protein
VLRPFGFGWVSPQPVYPVPAAEALGEIHDQRVVEPLIIRLQDDDSLVRSQSARVLREIGDPKAIQSLIQAFGLERYFDSDIPKVMPKLGFTAIDPLINILGNENTAIRRDATIALSSFGPSATG